MNFGLSSIVLLTVFSLALAVPYIIFKDEESQQYHLTPVLRRQRRDAPEMFGAGGANSKGQGGFVGIDNPNGSGGSVGYGHNKGFGHTVSVDGRVPVWSNTNRFGQSTLNVGGGATHHFGGPGGSRNLDKRVGINFNHRF